MTTGKRLGWKDWAVRILVTPPVIVVLVICVPPILVIFALWSILLNVSIWLFWCARGRRMLFVYSNSPYWQEHIEKEILPRLPDSTILLNWSERHNWPKFSFTNLVFHHYGGEQDFNPMAIIFRPLRTAIVLRFHDAFKQKKHGKPEALQVLETELFRFTER